MKLPQLLPLALLPLAASFTAPPLPKPLPPPTSLPALSRPALAAASVAGAAATGLLGKLLINRGSRPYEATGEKNSVAEEYDAWTQDGILEYYWGEVRGTSSWGGGGESEGLVMHHLGRGAEGWAWVWAKA